MRRFQGGRQPNPHHRQRGAAAVEFALIVPILLSLLLGVIDFGVAYGETISLQGAAREGARQGVTQGDVIASTIQARRSLDQAKLQVRFAVDTTAGSPGVMVVCTRYPQSSLTGFYAWALDGVFAAKAVMRMESVAAVPSGSKDWSGGLCVP